MGSHLVHKQGKSSFCTYDTKCKIFSFFPETTVNMCDRMECPLCANDHVHVIPNELSNLYSETGFLTGEAWNSMLLS